MTICIAAVCRNEGKSVFVIATDHMISVGIGQLSVGKNSEDLNKINIKFNNKSVELKKK